MGTLGPPPKSSLGNVANPAACSLAFDTVPAKPSDPAPLSDAVFDATSPSVAGATQSGSTS